MPLGKYVELIERGQDRGLYMDQFSFDRIPELKGDVSTTYANPGRRNIDLNLWLGPAGTFISLHKDNHNPFDHINNIFAQILGRKRIVLISPVFDHMMYPRSRDQGAHWHSQVNWESPDYAKFPLFRGVTIQEATLHPGEVAFIPGNYWHSLRSLDSSISVSCWWHVNRITDLVVSVMNRKSTRGEVITMPDIIEFGGLTRFVHALSDVDLPIHVRHIVLSLLDPTVTRSIASVDSQTTQGAQA